MRPRTAMDLGLAAIRQSRKLSLEDIARATNIGTFYLKAIEAGDLRKLPGEFYARSYVRQYAQAVGLNEEELLERFGLFPAPPEESEEKPREAAGVWQMALQWMTSRNTE